MSIGLRLVWSLILSIPVACLASTVTVCASTSNRNRLRYSRKKNRKLFKAAMMGDGGIRV